MAVIPTMTVATESGDVMKINREDFNPDTHIINDPILEAPAGDPIFGVPTDDPNLGPPHEPTVKDPNPLVQDPPPIKASQKKRAVKRTKK